MPHGLADPQPPERHVAQPRQPVDDGLFQLHPKDGEAGHSNGFDQAGGSRVDAVARHPNLYGRVVVPGQ